MSALCKDPGFLESLEGLEVSGALVLQAHEKQPQEAKAQPMEEGFGAYRAAEASRGKP